MGSVPDRFKLLEKGLEIHRKKLLSIADDKQFIPYRQIDSATSQGQSVKQWFLGYGAVTIITENQKIILNHVSKHRSFADALNKRLNGES